MNLCHTRCMKTSLDFEAQTVRFKQRFYGLPAVRKDMFKLLANLEDQVSELAKFEVTLRREPTPHNIERHKDMVLKLEVAFSEFEQWMTLSMLL